MKLLVKDQNGKILQEVPLKLAEKSLKIGRSESCDVIISSLSISREHLLLQSNAEGHICIQDLQSTFGTFVNGKKVQPGFLVQVNPGDRIQLSDEINLIIELENNDVPLSTRSTSPEATIFPFFMESNERFVKELFTEFRSKISGNYIQEINNLETAIADKVRELSAFLEVSFALSSLLNYQKLLEYTIDMAIKVTGAERGFLMLYNEESDRLETMVMRKIGSTEVERDMKASSSLVLRCFKSGETIVIGDTSIDPTISSNKSIVMNRIRSVALTPLRIQNSTIGVLYLDSRLLSNTFNNRVQEILKVFAAIASVAIHNARLYYMATTDGLTGLTNHKHFQQRLLEEFCRSIRHHKPLSLLMIDIDHFKSINDRYGHQAGDQALRLLSRILRTSMRIHDLPARYGGEEFAVLLPESGLEGAVTLAEKLRGIVEKASFTFGELKIKFTISIGVATADPNMRKPSDLVRTADQALYKAKASGRNRVMTGSFQVESRSEV